jgi:arsenical pump membrane protein
MVLQWILAATVVLGVATRPRSWTATAVVSTVAVASAAAEGVEALDQALRSVAPTAVFLVAAGGVAALAMRLGAARRTADWLASLAHGSGCRLFVLVCLVTAVVTALVSLDGAVVVMVPVLVELERRFGAPLRPLLLGVVAVANTFSLALPEANPTNLVVSGRLGLPVERAAATTVLPGVLAALVCAGAVA